MGVGELAPANRSGVGIGRQQRIHRLSKDFRSLPAELALSRRIEFVDASFVIERDNAIQGGVEDRTFTRFTFLERAVGLLALGDVHRDAADGEHLTARSLDWKL